LTEELRLAGGEIEELRSELLEERRGRTGITTTYKMKVLSPSSNVISSSYLDAETEITRLSAVKAQLASELAETRSEATQVQLQLEKTKDELQKEQKEKEDVCEQLTETSFRIEEVEATLQATQKRLDEQS